MTEGPSRLSFRKDGAIVAGLALLVVLTYLPVLDNGFIWDDDFYVTNNSTLSTMAGLAAIWGKPGATPQYYPLTFSTFWVEYQLWGLEPLGYHLDNVLLHVLNAILVYLVLRRLGVPGAALAAALFAVHPVHVESVAWVTERKNVLSGFFYGLALLAWLRFAPPEAEAKPGGWGWYLLALGAFLGALASKTVACSLPAVIVLLLWWKRGRIGRREALALLPMFAMGIAAGLQTVWLEKHHVGAKGLDWSLSFVERILIAGRALWFYAEKLVWPIDLTFIYPRWKIDPGLWWQYLFPLAAVGAIVALWAARRRLGKGPLIAVLFFCGTLFPALGFFDIYPMRYSFVADHFQYLASIGVLTLAAATAVAALRLPGYPWRQAALATSVLGPLAFLTFTQASVYRDQTSLWTDTLRKNPDCWLAHNHLGYIALQQNDLEEAEDHFQSSLRIYPSATDHYNLGLVRVRAGRFDEAIQQFDISRKMRPDFPGVYYQLGKIAMQRGKWQQAQWCFSQMVELDSRLWLGRLALGRALSAGGKLDEAIEQISESIRLNPTQADSHYQLGRVFTARGQPEKVIEAFQRAIDCQPDNPQYRFALGIALQRQGSLSAANREYEVAMDGDPGLWRMQAAKAAWELATDPNPRLRDGAVAVYLAELACRGSPRRIADLLDTLAAAYAEDGQFDQAVAVAREGVQAARDERQAAEINRRLSGYQSRRPFRAGPAQQLQN
jgi:tetratricopeptide (TPR) repeat protein